MVCCPRQCSVNIFLLHCSINNYARCRSTKSRVQTSDAWRTLIQVSCWLIHEFICEFICLWIHSSIHSILFSFFLSPISLFPLFLCFVVIISVWSQRVRSSICLPASQPIIMSVHPYACSSVCSTVNLLSRSVGVQHELRSPVSPWGPAGVSWVQLRTAREASSFR